jgi:hypothetical protein
MILTPDEKKSFDGAYRTVTVTGPVSLFRLCGKTARGAASNPFGRFWFNANFFWKLVDAASDRATSTAELNHYLRYILREFTAVCHDWNSFAAIYELAVPAGTKMEATVGRIRPQPFYSAADPQRRSALPHEILVGGEFQYIIDLRAGSALRSRVAGPRPLWVSRAGNA